MSANLCQYAECRLFGALAGVAWQVDHDPGAGLTHEQRRVRLEELTLLALSGWADGWCQYALRRFRLGEGLAPLEAMPLLQRRAAA